MIIRLKRNNGIYESVGVPLKEKPEREGRGLKYEKGTGKIRFFSGDLSKFCVQPVNYRVTLNKNIQQPL